MSSENQVPAVPTEIAEGIAKFEPAKLRHVDVREKTVLPSKEDVEDEKKRKSFVNTIESFDHHKLKKAETVEKNILPDKATIDQEKSNS